MAYRAIDPDAYRDSATSTYVIVGGGFGLIGLTLLVSGLAVVFQALEYSVPRQVAGVVAVFGLVPYPWFVGPPAIVANVVLLGVAVLILATRRARGGGYFMVVAKRHR